MVAARSFFLICCVAGWLVLFHLPVVHAQEFDPEMVLKEHPEIRVAIEQKIIDQQNLKTVLMLFQQGQYSEAIPLVEESIKKGEEVLGPEHAFTATTKDFLAIIYGRLGKYDQAETLQRQALDIRLKILGPEHPHTAISLHRLERLYYARGAFDQVQEINLNVILRRNPEIIEAIKLKILDRQLIIKVFELQRQGRFAEAIPIVEDTIQKSEGKMGMNHPFVAKATDYLAELYSNAGDPKALELNLKALKLLEKAKGLDHPDVATSLFNLGIIYEYMGDYIKAIELHQRALIIREKAFGVEHRETAASLNMLGVLCQYFGDLDMAAPFLLQAFSIRAKVLGVEHPFTASSANNLANIYLAKGDHKKAEEIFKEALAIKEKFHGKNDLDFSITLANLAVISYLSGDYKKAEEMLERVLEIRRKLLGPNHWRVFEALETLFLVYVAKGQLETAFNLGKRIIDKDDKLIEQVFSSSSEYQKILFGYKKKGMIAKMISFVHQFCQLNLHAKEIALTTWLNRKGIVLEALRSHQETLIDTDDNKIKATLQELHKIRVQLSNTIFSNSLIDEQKYFELETRKENLESELSKTSRYYAMQKKMAKVDVKQIARSLPAKSVLIEIAEIQLVNFSPKNQQNIKWPLHYIAFVLPAGESDGVDLIDLGETEKINNAISGFRKLITEVKGHDKIKDSYPKLIESSKQIYNLIFNPIKDKLKGVHEIFISPDGDINLLPFEVLVGKDGKFLIEYYRFNYLPTGRDLLRFGQIKRQAKKYILMGDPDFDLNWLEKKEILSKMGIQKGKNLEVALRSPDLTGISFKRLQAAGEEVKAIQSILGNSLSVLYTGKYALEEVLHEMEPPKILHLATHGFSLGDHGIERYLPPNSERGIQSAPMLAERIKVWVKAKNPLLLSGFVLAGANVSVKKGLPEGPDGIITAEKVIGLNLWGTDMVVLSACVTGLGDVRSGEGIFGLRRAFSIAGAKSLVTSMWGIPDQETKELMTAFYKNIKDGMNRCQALRQAALHQKQVVKERYGHAHPLFWGGFIFSGEP